MAGEFDFSELLRSPEEISRAHMERMAKVEELQQQVATAEAGVKSNDERISVTYNETDGVKVELDPRALRMSSEDLAEEITRLVNEARSQTRQQIQDLFTDEAEDGLSDPRQVLEQLPEMEQSIDELLRETQGMSSELTDMVQRMQRMAESQSFRPRRDSDG